MEDQLGALGIVLNCVVLWNTVYINSALNQLRTQGYPVRDGDVARLSPFMRKHINEGYRKLSSASFRGSPSNC